MLTICSCLFYHAAEHLRTYLALSRLCAQPSPALRFRFPREGRGGEEVFFRDLQTFLGSVCGDRFVTQGYCVRAVLEVEFKAVLSESQGSTCTCGACLSGPHNCVSSLSTKSCSTCRSSLVWMVQFGQGHLIGFPKTFPRVSRVRVSAVYPVDGGLYVGEVYGHFSGVGR